MRTFDLAPLHRFAVGFDQLNRLLDAAGRMEEAPAYPPYNIEKHGEDKYRVTMAVAGFAPTDLDLTIHGETLIVSGHQHEVAEDGSAEVTFLHRGIATRAFERRFQLADHIKVVGASLDNGLLRIDLVREVPEAKKPRKIAIAAGIGPQALPATEAPKADAAA